MGLFVEVVDLLPSTLWKIVKVVGFIALEGLAWNYLAGEWLGWWGALLWLALNIWLVRYLYVRDKRKMSKKQ